MITIQISGDDAATVQALQAALSTAGVQYQTYALPQINLTPRELQVLKLIASGMSNKDMSAHLEISEKTVKSHVNQVLSKLQVTSRTQAALYALRHGIATLDAEPAPVPAPVEVPV